MKLISFNVNGIRAVMNKGFADFFNEVNADIFCIQESKIQEDQIEFKFDNYYMYVNSAEKKGYSGTIVFSKIKPINVTYGIGIEEHDREGRIITLEYEDFYLINSYVPNSKRELERLDYRMEYEEALRLYMKELDTRKPLIMCGDLNVAHREIDLTNPKTNTKNAGFTIEERDAFTRLLDTGFIDTFRYIKGDEIKYSWWSYMRQARERNIGWRIDYFVVSTRFKNRVVNADILCEILGSDHAPVMLEIK